MIRLIAKLIRPGQHRRSLAPVYSPCPSRRTPEQLGLFTEDALSVADAEAAQADVEHDPYLDLWEANDAMGVEARPLAEPDYA